MNCSENQSVTIIKGEERVLALRIQKKNGSSFDLTSVTEVTAKLKNADNTILSKTMTGGFIVVTDAPAGKFTLTLSEAETTLLKKGEKLDFTVDFQFGTVLRKANFYKMLTIIDASV